MNVLTLCAICLLLAPAASASDPAGDDAAQPNGNEGASAGHAGFFARSNCLTVDVTQVPPEVVVHPEDCLPEAP